MKFSKIAFDSTTYESRYKKKKWFTALFIGIPAFLTLHLFLLSFLILKLNVVELFFHLFPQSNLQGVNILAFGIDETRATKRSDTIMVFHIDQQNKHVGILSIPRDTRVNIEGHGKTRINHAYSYGEHPLLKQTVSNFLGVPIDYYIKVDLSGISKLIDEIGGLDIDVKQDLKYTDRAGDLYIDIDKGYQNLDGQKAIQYLRFRYDGKGDIGRIQRQQTFLSEVTNKLLSVGSLYKTPKIVSLINDVIDTDLSTPEMISLLLHFKDAIQQNRVKKETVPGASVLIADAYYWKANVTALDKMVDEVLFGFSQDKAPPAYAEVRSEKKVEKKRERPRGASSVETLEYETLEPVVITEELLPEDATIELLPNEELIATAEELTNEPAHLSSPVEIAESSPEPVREIPIIEEPKPERRKATAKEIKRVAEVSDLSIEALDTSLIIEVLNGIGVNGVARQTASTLKKLDLRVPLFENAGHFNYENTILIAWKGNIDGAVALANIFEIDPEHIIVYDRPEKPLDITLVIGQDWLAKQEIFNKIDDYAKRKAE